jgi:RNA 3'-terminal phosphate cyclase (ATP)
VEGASLGSSRVDFEPSALQAGDFAFDVGTAGSTSLVLQTVLLPLALAGAVSHVKVIGGTHVRWSPCFEYLDWHWRRFAGQVGLQLELSLAKAGYFPRGGGEVRATVRPGGELAPLDLGERGPLQSVRGLSAVSNLPMSIADRQRDQALHRLASLNCPCSISRDAVPSVGKGTAVVLLAEFETSQVCFFGLGERGKPAERVADEAVEQLIAFLETDGAVDKYLGDQLLLPLASASGPSRVRVSEVTQHLLTNAEVLRAFGAARIEIDADLGQPGWVRVSPGA